MAKFIKVPTFDIFDEETGLWAPKEKWWLEGECIYQSDIKHTESDNAGILVTVPDRFETDLASIPRLARLLIPKNDRHRAPAVVHDYLCRLDDFSRKTADKIFLEAMALVGVKRVRRRAMYLAVRIGAMKNIFKRGKKS